MAVKKRTIIIVILLSVITIAALCVPVWFYFADKLSRLDSYKESITKTAREKFNRDLTYETGNATLTLRNGISIRFTNVVIKEKDGSSDFLKVKNAFFRVNILPLLRNRLVLGEVILSQPQVSLKRDSAGDMNIADLLTRKEDKNAPKIRKMIVEKGLVTLLDQAASEEGILTSLENLDCRIDSPFWTKKSRFTIKSFIIENTNKAELTLEGTYRPAPYEKPVYESTLRASIHLKGTDLKHYNCYLKKYTPIEQTTGRLDADIKISGKFSDFKSSGAVKVKKALMNYPGVFRDSLQPRLIEVDYALKRDETSLNLDVKRLAVDKFEASGSFDIDDLDKKDPLLKASAVTSFFALGEFKSYIPWGIIPTHVGDFIDMHVRDGNFRLVEGKLKGRLSQVAHMNKKESVDVLSISAEVNKGVFETGGTAPVFHDISGTLELKQRQFMLKKMKGRFGLSPLTMEGSISDFSHPVLYTAEMKLQPQRNEILWLLGKERFRSLNFKGPSALTLSGKGPSDNYHINANWDLTNAAYSYPDILEKPIAMKNRIVAAIILNKDAFNIPSFNYDLPQANVTGAMMFLFSGGAPASFNIKSKTFDVREAMPILPFLREFNPTGQFSAAVAVRGDLSKSSSIQWNGNVSLANVSLTPSANIKPLKGLTGNAIFKGNSMESSLFKAQMGQSILQGNFRIDDLRKPKLVCQFNTDLFRAEDLGLETPEGEVKLRDVKGQIGIENKLIHVDHLLFKLGQSSFNLSGDVSDLALPRITVVLTSNYIMSDDFTRLISLKYSKKPDNASSAMELNATLRVDAGRFSDVDFKNLKAELKFIPGILDVEKLEAGLFDGKFKAKGKANIKPGGQNYYEANITVNRMSLDKIRSYMEIGNRTLTGYLSLTGDITATAGNADDFRRTLAGTFQVRSEKGVLKKFSALSKIFSLLNVLQLAKLKLPDMTTEGMAYSTIAFNASMKDGVLNTKDFFLDSDSLQISASGNVDILKKTIDCVAGIHPLQSIDLIASKIPIAGGFITDARGKLITVRFMIDGPWDNPNVNRK